LILDSGAFDLCAPAWRGEILDLRFFGGSIDDRRLCSTAAIITLSVPAPSGKSASQIGGSLKVRASTFIAP
jgi:hypothetical protein